MHAMDALYVFVVVAAVGTALGTGMQPTSEESSLDYGDLVKHRDECIKQLGVSVREDDFKVVGSSNPNWKIMLCLMEKDGTIGPDGRFSGDGILAHVEKMLKIQPNRLAYARSVISKCRPELEKETAVKEELAQKITECFHKQESESEQGSTNAPM